ncbi:MAG: hypothetical protein FIA95_16490 [Gemmatimonadetes bacterium]|nr:hypothetical protein [Gemmatimonadota bacterium]
MTHLDEAELLALRDEARSADARLLRHVEACSVCREELAALRRQAGSGARALDALEAAPGDLARAREAVRLRVAAHGAQAAGGVSLPARSCRRALWGLSRAAGILLVTAAGLSALPGSPVRAWIGRLVGPAAEERTAPATAPAPAPAAAAAEAPPEEAGVRLPLAGGPLVVVLRGASPGTEIRVTWVPGDEAALFAPVGSRFTSGEGRLEAALAPGPVRVEVRRGVSPFSLEVNGSVLLRSSPQGLEVGGSVVERGAAGITFVVPPR